MKNIQTNTSSTKVPGGITQIFLISELSSPHGGEQTKTGDLYIITF